MPLLRGAVANPGAAQPLANKARLQQTNYSDLEDLEDSEDDRSKEIHKDQGACRAPQPPQPAALAKPALDVLEDDLEDDEIEQSTAVVQPSPPQMPRSRLQRNDQQPSVPNRGLDELLAGVRRMGLNNSGPHVKQPSTDSTLLRAEMLAAAQAQLPSSSDGDESDSDESSSSSSPEDEQPRGTGGNGLGKPLSSTQKPSSKAQQLPLKPHAGGSSSTSAAPGKQQPAEGSLVLTDPTGRKLVLSPQLHSKLYPHQVEGVRWLWSLFASGKGGILGDDMGLGKTMQCCAFLAGLLGSNLATRALVIAPKTLLLHWEKELGVCGLSARTYPFYGDSASERANSLRAATGPRGGVLLTTYGMILHNAPQLLAPAQSPYRGFSKGRGGDDDDVDDGAEFAWDFIILDEGHKVKNPKMKLVEELRRIPVKHTVIISGTPIQNNLSELHALFDLCCEGLLGDRKYFKRVYEGPITRGQDKGASAREREVGAAVAAELRKVIGPFFLRREKAQVLGSNTNSGDASSAGGASGSSGSGSTQQQEVGRSSSQGASTSSGAAKPQALGHKNDLVVWLKLRPLQKAIYTAFLNSEPVKRALNETDSPLAALTVLKKICDHPALLSERAASAVMSGSHKWAQQRGKGQQQAGKGQRKGKTKHGYKDDDGFIVGSSDEEEGGSEEGSDESGSSSGSEAEEESLACAGVRGQQKKGELVLEAEEAGVVSQLLASLKGSNLQQQLMHEMDSKGAQSSCKTAFVLELLQELAAKGHRTLVFSQSRVMLDILQAAFSALGMACCRIDGTIASAVDRQDEVRRFQAPGSTIPVFLLTSQVGGLGLTLTAADRVVIVDPSWNPSVDNQAVDRAYRIGQKRDVVVYRLITCGTVEEKIYRKQVFKGGLSRTGTEEGIQFRYFTQQQLRDLFTVTPEGLQSSTTQQELHKLHSKQRRTDAELDQHLDFLGTLEGYAGISDHDLLFSTRPEDAQRLANADGQRILSELEAQAAREGDRGGGGGRKGGKRQPGTVGTWKGGDKELSSLFANALNLAGRDPAEQALSQQRHRVQDLEQRLRSQSQTLASIGRSMPDGGAKLRDQIRRLEAELSQEQAKLQEQSIAKPPVTLDLTDQPHVSSSSQGYPSSTVTATVTAATAAPAVVATPGPVGRGPAVHQPQQQYRGAGTSSSAGTAADHPGGARTIAHVDLTSPCTSEAAAHGQQAQGQSCRHPGAGGATSVASPAPSQAQQMYVTTPASVASAATASAISAQVLAGGAALSAAAGAATGSFQSTPGAAVAAAAMAGPHPGSAVSSHSPQASDQSSGSRRSRGLNVTVARLKPAVVPTSSQHSTGSQAIATGTVSRQAAQASTRAGMGLGTTGLGQAAGQPPEKSTPEHLGRQERPATSEASSFVTAESYGQGSEAASPEVTSMARPLDRQHGVPVNQRQAPPPNAGRQSGKAATMIDLTDSP